MSESMFGSPSQLLTTKLGSDSMQTGNGVRMSVPVHQPPPSFADIQFGTIGKPPNLLSRISAPDPGQMSFHSPSPPTLHLPPPVPTHAPVTNSRKLAERIQMGPSQLNSSAKSQNLHPAREPLPAPRIDRKPLLQALANAPANKVREALTPGLVYPGSFIVTPTTEQSNRNILSSSNPSGSPKSHHSVGFSPQATPISLSPNSKTAGTSSSQVSDVQVAQDSLSALYARLLEKSKTVSLALPTSSVRTPSPFAPPPDIPDLAASIRSEMNVEDLSAIVLRHPYPQSNSTSNADDASRNIRTESLVQVIKKLQSVAEGAVKLQLDANQAFEKHMLTREAECEAQMQMEQRLVALEEESRLREETRRARDAQRRAQDDQRRFEDESRRTAIQKEIDEAMKLLQEWETEKERVERERTLAQNNAVPLQLFADIEPRIKAVDYHNKSLNLKKQIALIRQSFDTLQNMKKTQRQLGRRGCAEVLRGTVAKHPARYEYGIAARPYCAIARSKRPLILRELRAMLCLVHQPRTVPPSSSMSTPTSSSTAPASYKTPSFVQFSLHFSASPPLSDGPLPTSKKVALPSTPNDSNDQQANLSPAQRAANLRHIKKNRHRVEESAAGDRSVKQPDNPLPIKVIKTEELEQTSSLLEKGSSTRSTIDTMAKTTNTDASQINDIPQTSVELTGITESVTGLAPNSPSPWVMDASVVRQEWTPDAISSHSEPSESTCRRDPNQRSRQNSQIDGRTRSPESSGFTRGNGTSGESRSQRQRRAPRYSDHYSPPPTSATSSHHRHLEQNEAGAYVHPIPPHPMSPMNSSRKRPAEHDTEYDNRDRRRPRGGHYAPERDYRNSSGLSRQSPAIETEWQRGRSTSLERRSSIHDRLRSPSPSRQIRPHTERNTFERHGRNEGSYRPDYTNACGWPAVEERDFRGRGNINRGRGRGKGDVGRGRGGAGGRGRPQQPLPSRPLEERIAK
ncbi:uncharacterized protein EDB93DRAFT_1183597 [Suillus bovinus]|uniref:uncharacterized protein n=1 Tax=Suillus bovinus TaxID=48563 RepID=UPI001B85BFD4|nr:uncharacterized protein EDB93DRAFT_1183597 [Suillus bovinus]KAG2128951.1 hypothetical protein EDB93DRAFT_1183597 [Suillus bovinus]